MNFKGHFAVGNVCCYSLTILDDYSRYDVALAVCAQPIPPIEYGTQTIWLSKQGGWISIQRQGTAFFQSTRRTTSCPAPFP
jgi:hypothetical protein